MSPPFRLLPSSSASRFSRHASSNNCEYCLLFLPYMQCKQQSWRNGRHSGTIIPEGNTGISDIQKDSLTKWMAFVNVIWPPLFYSPLEVSFNTPKSFLHSCRLAPYSSFGIAFAILSRISRARCITSSFKLLTDPYFPCQHLWMMVSMSFSYTLGNFFSWRRLTTIWPWSSPNHSLS